MQFTVQEQAWMAQALALASAHRHGVHPNPMVGCVLVKAGRVIGQGAHERFGGPHAELMALADARRRGEDPRGASAYLTLEPCSHHGKTPPCAEALAGVGLAEVVYATGDPNPLVNGKGAEFLLQAGVAVRHGLLGEEARELNRGFLRRVTQGLPWVTLKTAQSLDGKLADHTGASQWLTAPAARESVMDLRHGHDAVLVGSGTLLADDPLLTVRPARGQQPVRVALDLSGRLPRLPRLVSEDPSRAWLLTSGHAQNLFYDDFVAAGGHLLRLEAPPGEHRPPLSAVLLRLTQEGLTSVLVEAGPQLATALLEQGLVDEWQLFMAPLLLGGGERHAVYAPATPPPLTLAPSFATTALRQHPRPGGGADLQWTLRRGGEAR